VVFKIYVAGVAELVDAHASGACDSNVVPVQVRLPVPVFAPLELLLAGQSL
jgi:hypothetical protein